MIVEDAIECIGVFFGMLTAFPIELAGIVHTLASSIRPPLYILKPLLQRFSLFCHFRVGNGGFGIAMIAIDAKRNEPVPNDVLLGRPASRVGLHQFYRICHGLRR